MQQETVYLQHRIEFIFYLSDIRYRNRKYNLLRELFIIEIKEIRNFLVSDGSGIYCENRAGYRKVDSKFSFVVEKVSFKGLTESCIGYAIFNFGVKESY